MPLAPSRSWRPLVLIAIGASALGLGSGCDRGHSAGPAAARGTAPARAIAAKGLTLQPRRVETVVETTGTILAQESVEIVSELSRRVVEVAAREGAAVAAGALLFKLDDRDLLAQRETLSVRRRLAQQNEARRRQLLDSGVLSREVYDTSLTELQLIEAQLAELAVTLSKTEIRAPFAGVVGVRSVSPGAWVTPARVMATLVADDPVRLDFLVPERYAPAIAAGQRFSFAVESAAGAREGRVVVIDSVIDAATRSLRVRGAARNADRRLRPGAFVTLSLPLAVSDEGLLVPSEAVIPSAGGHGVFVFERGTANWREVELGERSAREVELRSGVKAGEIVLVSNLLRLRPGIAVTLESDSTP